MTNLEQRVIESVNRTGVPYEIIEIDPAYSDTNSFSETYGQPEIPIGLAYEREGTYAVTVSKSGYKAWTASGVRVIRDGCHVRTVKLNARLQR